MARSSVLLVLVAALACVPACNEKNGKQPVVASAAGEYGYASRFPSEMSDARGGITEKEAEAKQKSADFPGYPSELDNPSYEHVRIVYEKADKEGQSASYVKGSQESETVSEFFKDEKDELSRKVAGAAEYTADQKGCAKSGAGSAAVSAMNRAVEDRLEKRLRAQSDAHLYIEENPDSLGKKNTEKLAHHADEIARASYLVKVALVESKLRIQAMVDESSQIKSTLTRSAKEAQQVIDDPNRGEEDKKAAKKRLEVASKANEEIDGEVSQAKAALKEIDERLKTSRKEYDKAFGDLIDAVEAKAKEQKKQKNKS